uniref:Pentatricopeptide repeat-containing protein n=2 Tax=Kalanchoe fedtschenkoi TaxID=63787 RepID=A0A7N0TRN9_KALFE
MLSSRQRVFEALYSVGAAALKRSNRLSRSLHTSSVLAHQMFDRIPQPHSFPLIPKNHEFDAIEAFRTQLHLGMPQNIDEIAVSRALKGCRGDPKLGCQIHAFAIASGLDSFLTVCNSLMNMYFKSANFDMGLCIFEGMSCPDIVSWNTVLSGSQDSASAFRLAVRMNEFGVGFDAVTCTTVLSFCSISEEFLFGLQTHCLIAKRGLGCDVFVGNSLMSFYFKWRWVEDGKRVFDEMPNRDFVSWNAVISGYAQDGNHGHEAIRSFLEMAREGMMLDHVSFTGVVSACGHEVQLEAGKQIHGLALKRGCGAHVSVGNVLISMYSKCEAVDDAKLVFEKMCERNVVSWTTMISIDDEAAVSLYKYMLADGVSPNDVTFIGLIHAISNQSLVKEGSMVHGHCTKAGFLSELNVCNSFVTMYAKFEFMAEAVKVFEEISYREIETWNTLISGYAQNGMSQESVEAFYSAMRVSRPTQYTFGSVLNAIADAEAISLQHGQICHSYIIKIGFSLDPIVCGALLDMYAKRGDISEAQKVFNELSHRSQFSYTGIISAYASHGDLNSVMTLFNQMEEEGVRPDSITFLSVLALCGRLGMVDLGHKIYDTMLRGHKIEPSPEHYSCMVDMLGRAGRLKEAELFVSRIPGGPGLSVLQSLLGSCRTHKNVGMGERVADQLIGMEPTESGSYVLMSNLYAENGEWEKAAKVRRAMREQGVRKEIGFSWVDVGGGGIDDSLRLHGFSSSDMSHPRSGDICYMASFVDYEMKVFESERVSFLLTNTPGTAEDRQT